MTVIPNDIYTEIPNDIYTEIPNDIHTKIPHHKSLIFIIVMLGKSKINPNYNHYI